VRSRATSPVTFTPLRFSVSASAVAANSGGSWTGIENGSTLADSELSAERNLVRPLRADEADDVVLPAADARVADGDVAGMGGSVR
jgi:hypothetical protein